MVFKTLEFSSIETFNNMKLDDVAKHFNALIPSPANYGGTGDKGQWHHDYLDYYEKILNRIPANFQMLEIGIAGGYSIASFFEKI